MKFPSKSFTLAVKTMLPHDGNRATMKCRAYRYMYVHSFTISVCTLQIIEKLHVCKIIKPFHGVNRK